MKKKKINILKSIYVVLLVSMVFSSILSILSLKNNTYPSITEEEAIENIDNIEKVMVTNGDYLIKTNDGLYLCTPTSALDFSQKLFAADIVTEYVNGLNQETASNIIANLFADVLFITLLYFILKFIFGLMNFGKSIGSSDSEYMKDLKKQMESLNPKTSLNIKKEIPNVKFSDVQGCDELKRDAKSLIDYLQNPYKYNVMGARMPKGTMLYGPPGTGKTLIAKAIAGEAGVPFFNVSGSDFIEMYVGVGAKRVRELFEVANKNAPCIVFIDEIDAIAGKRGSSQNTERDQTINAILTEMDGFASNKGVMVIAATNRLDMLDPAILRAGRFDKHLAVPLPDKDGRLAILKLHSKNKRLDDSVNLEIIAKQTTGFSGASLENLLNQATLLAVDNDKKFVSSEEIDRAFFKVVMQGDIKDGQSKRGKKELELVAWHEAGHTLITKLLTRDEVTRVTILSSTSGAGGVTFHNPPEGEFYSKQDLKNRIALAYGGRAAEEIFFGNHEHVTIGASSDIQSASESIKNYIMKYGMSDKFGMLDISVFDNQSMSNDDIIKEASSLANEIYSYTLNTLKDNEELLKLIASELLEKETLLDSDINRIMGIETPKTEEAEALKSSEVMI